MNRTTKTTVRLALSPALAARLALARFARWMKHTAEDEPVIVISALVLLLAGALATLGMASAATAAPPQIIVVAPTPTLGVAVAAVAAPAGPRLPVAAVAYAAPGGAALGALEAGRPYTPVARWGAAWLLIDAPGSGQVWVQVAAVGLPAGELPDIAPTAAPERVIEVVYVDRPAPAAVVAAPVATATPSYLELAPTPEGWPGVPYALNAAPPAGPARDCPFVLSPAELEACLAGQ